jgi:hypothetical protein
MRHRATPVLLLSLLSLAVVLLLAGPDAVAQVAPPELEVPGTSAGAAAPSTHAQASGELLTGTFRLTAGSCTDDGASGTYFRMTQPAGQPIDNGDSPCDDKSYTPLSPGSDGGLVTGSYQPHPDPAFDSNGNGMNEALTEPARFYGVNFSTATNATDPQTDTDVMAPEIRAAADGSISGDLRAFAAAWNGQHFNQGSPKPDGEKPEGTEGPTGTYDDATGAFELEWSSRISGGPFNNFIGTWHFTGTFESSQSTPPSSSSSSPPQSDGGSSASASQQAATPGRTAAAATSTGDANAAHPRTGAPMTAGLVGVALAGAFAVTRLLQRNVRPQP